MLRSLKEIRGYTLHGTDDEIGVVEDFYFDDSQWCIRYWVIDVGVFLSGRKVLVPASEIAKPDGSERMVNVPMTRDQVRNSPEIDAAKPVSRQQEAELFDHFQWMPYWAPYSAMGPNQPLSIPLETEGESPPPGAEGPPSLRSFDEVIGYAISARDGDVGHVDDLIAEDGDWTLPLLAVDTRNWLPGRHVVIGTTSIEAIRWDAKEVNVRLKKADIEAGPEYDPTRPIDPELQ